ncbi:Sodium/calcium exchanger protein [Carex littledalei]|uniref:Sodium/calcium exchanger protein n=1 Tax=Carex littledalei TaxID=544730 RepID=A0A833V6X9_9POAL|nr:Sodium/calcium exchanger protein [Carex littledalei]
MARTRRCSASLFSTLVVFTLLLALGGTSHARLLSRLVSDGVDGNGESTTPIIRLPRGFIRAPEESCEQTYGLLPCTTTGLGNLFLIMAYGFLMYKAATFLSSGSEMLLEIMGPGIIGGLFLPILGALPDAMLILVSGLSGNKETAQSQVLIGMGLLAGSTVMLITLLWGSCIVVGKCDLGDRNTSLDMQDTKGFNLFGSGVTTDRQTSDAAKIMGISILPLIVVQIPKVFPHVDQSLGVLCALIFAVLLLIVYCLYQVFQPWIQKRRLAYAKHKHVISGILKHAQKEAVGRLLNENGEPNIAVIHKLFRKIDLDKNGLLSRKELRAFIIGMSLKELDLDSDEALDEAVDKVIDEFDSSGDNELNVDEFTGGICKYLGEAKDGVPKSGADSSKFIHEFHSKAGAEHKQVAEGSDEVVESVENSTLMITKAVLLLVLGTVMAAAFADPLVDAVDNFSLATSIPSFFISFIFMPLATNSSEAVSALIFASRKQQRTSSLTFSEIYGGVTMNNTLCLAVFLALVYVRGLTWDFTSEVLIILLVCIIMGLFTCFRTTFPLWTCFVAYLLYPLSLLLVYILDFVFGWS